jgi:large subunit ribosomal protein L30
MAEKLLKVTQVRSELGHVSRNRGTIRALGLDRIGHSNILPDNPAVRGAIRQVRFLVEAEELSGAEAEAGAKVVAAKKVKHAKHAKKAKRVAK